MRRMMPKDRPIQSTESGWNRGLMDEATLMREARAMQAECIREICRATFRYLRRAWRGGHSALKAWWLRGYRKRGMT